MRKILFRGKRKNDGEWVEGFLLKECNHSTCSWNLGIEYKTERSGAFAYDVAEINSKTVGQYTGLTDKNGKKIFEGDIVNIENRKYRVSFEKGCWVILGKSEFWDFLQTNAKSCEVIGNVFDNPELLGDK